MTDQDRVALNFFRNLMRLWGCTPDQQNQLLGCAAPCELELWQAHGLPHGALVRISHLIGIHRALRAIFGGDPAVYGWISRSNQSPLFAGRAALELLIDGRFVEVREYLENEVGVKGILERKRRRQQELITAIRAASPKELEASAEKIREVMRASKGGGRQRMEPPSFRNDHDD